MEEKNKNWNLKKLERQAMENQNFDNFVLNQSKILEYENLKVLDVGCSNGCKTEMLFGKYENIDNITGIDVDENAINEAKSKFVNNKKYLSLTIYTHVCRYLLRRWSCFNIATQCTYLAICCL